MSSALLDTSALINAVDADAVEELPFDRLFISSLSYAELRLGLVTARDVRTLRQRSRRIESIERSFGRGLPFDDACALEYEQLVQLSVDHGLSARSHTVDRMIAAVAVAHEIPLVTSNGSDVRGLESVLDIVVL
ncbi:hypothetical protein SAMN06298212_101181 [Ruaniaceae bacterium KH17]|nr:hypothetical protein SAMN06298212_101181 [Ruaniaceae bacterium KH17]